MSKTIEIVQIEDDATDLELTRAILRSEGIDAQIEEVAARASLETALAKGGFDLILSDFTLPSFSGDEALEMARAICPDVPFIFFSGTIGEEAAVDSLKNGATDYVLKHRPERLGPAILRALAEADERAKVKQAHEQLQEQAALLNKASDAICVLSVDRNVTFWNTGAENLYGWRVAEVLGKRADYIRFQHDSSGWDEAFRMLLETGEWAGDVTQTTRSGAELIVHSRWTLLRDGAGGPKSILMINTDVTEKRLMEKQLLQAQRMECIGALASGVAHDLNNVLAPILMGGELLSSRLKDPEDLRLVGMLHRAAERGAGIIKQVLSFARGPGQGRSQVQLKHLINEQSKIATEIFPKSISIETPLPQELWPVHADPNQLHQVLMNLYVNARDAMPDGGILRISALNRDLEPAEAAGHPAKPPPGRYVEVTVADTGTGIPQEVIEKIFDPLFTTKPIGKGTGLGLCSVLSIVKGHGGFLDVTSEVGRGTAFRICLPATAGALAEEGEKGVLDLPAGRGEMVLVVDDERTIREIIRGTLESYGYKTLSASDGTEGLAIYVERSGDIDAVVTDVDMPHLDGIHMFRALRKINPGLPVIMATGSGNQARLQELMESTDVTLLRQPYKTEELLSALRRVLDS